jgi:hypothetical protein
MRITRPSPARRSDSHPTCRRSVGFRSRALSNVTCYGWWDHKPVPQCSGGRPMRVPFFTPANAPISTAAELPPMTNASFPQERPIFSIPRSRIDCFPFMIQARSALAKTKSVVKNILAGWCPSIPFSPRKGTCASVSLKNGDDQFCLLDEHQTEDHDSTGPTIYFPLANLRSNFDQICEPNRTDTALRRPI